MPESWISRQELEGSTPAPGADGGGARGDLAGRVLGDRYRVVETLAPLIAPRPGEASYRAERLDGGARALLWHVEAPGSAEGDLLARLRAQAAQVDRVAAHTAAVAVIDECLPVEDGSVAVLMALPMGPTLAEVLRRDGPFSVERAVRTAAKVAEALEVAHDLGAIHGGLGPHNVVALDGAGEGVQLLRFGMDWIWLATRASTLGLGTTQPARLSPEQIAGGEPTRRSDVYALGALLYGLLAGASPRPTAARRRPPLTEVRADVPPSLARIVARALEPKPERRQRDMTDFFNDLWTELDPLWPARPVHEAPRGWRRWADLTARVVASAVVVAAGVWVAIPLVYSPSHRPPPVEPPSMITVRVPVSPAPPMPSAAASSAAPASSASASLPVADAATTAPVADPAPEVTAPPPAVAERAAPSARPAPDRRARGAAVEEPRRTARETAPAAPVETPRAERPAPARSPVVAGEPARSRPAPDTADDPGAIIDWVLLQRGGQRD